MIKDNLAGGKKFAVRAKPVLRKGRTNPGGKSSNWNVMWVLILARPNNKNPDFGFFAFFYF